jgi:dymeclin
LTVLQIVLLVLSQDEGLAKSVHKISVRSVPWHKEATLVDIPVGSLMFTVLLRATHKNLIGAKDVYLHSNALAALANLAPFAVNLTSHATNRLVAVLETGYKRLKWLSGPRVGSFIAC